MPFVYGNKPINGVTCPLCQAETGTVLYVVTAPESAKAFVTPSSNPHIYRELTKVISGLWGEEECRQIRCDKCQCVYAWPHCGGDARFYNLAFREHMRYPQERWEFFAATRFLEGSQIGPVLELGAGDGAFVRLLRKFGVPAELISVIEYSEVACNQIRSLDIGLQLYSSLDCFYKNAKQEAYSHVFAFQVLEHVQLPIEYLTVFRSILKKDGIVCMAVPNPARIEANERNGLLLDMPPCHVTRFTNKGISSLATRAGFEVVQIETEPVVYRDWLREYLAYHFRRRVQNEGSLQNLMEKLLPWRLATIGGALLALPSALLRSSDSKEGGSIFCVLRAI